MDSHKKICCSNPFNRPGHFNCKKNLRPVQEWMIRKTRKIKKLESNFKICNTCRIKISQMASPEVTDDEISSDDTTTITSGTNDEMTAELTSDIGVETLNESISFLGESPVKKKRLQEKNYPAEKYQKVSSAIKTNIFHLEASTSHDKCQCPAETETLNQLKDKFSQTISRSEKIQILTVLPKSWSIPKIIKEFGATNYMVRIAKKLVKEKGILSTPNLKSARSLDDATLKCVKEYYSSDEISRCMPGKKDFISIRESGIKTQKQKRLILSNLREIYSSFKEKYPSIKIGFSKFCELRPKNCVLAGASGTHTVCVCILHQNVKLMMEGCRMKQLTTDDDFPIKSYDHCMAMMICNPPLPNCYFGLCKNCPGASSLRERIDNLFEMNGIDEITYSSWISTDRAELLKLTESSDQFLDSFIKKKLEKLVPHAFVAFQQHKFLEELKNNLSEGECIVQCDFAENYSFILQDEIQGYHWNNSQATIHPFIIYFKKLGCDNIEHKSFIIISDCLQHDTTTVHLYQRYLIDFLVTTYGNLPKYIYYFSDGAAAHYKNRKNFINLCNHKQDFGVSAEWHFFATAHGKGPCDGIGGTIKRLVSRASLQRPYSDQIMTPRRLFEWSEKNIHKCHFCYITNDEYEKEYILLKGRFEHSRTIPGTHKKHAFIPIDKDTVKTKFYSNSDDFINEKVTISDCDRNLENIKGFVTCFYDKNWWVGCVIDTDEESEEVKISFLHPHGPSKSFVYPSSPDILKISKQNVLTQVDLRTVTGRTYYLMKEDIRKTEEMYIVYGSTSPSHV